MLGRVRCELPVLQAAFISTWARRSIQRAPMYVVHVVQGVNTGLRQPVALARAPVSGQKATYCKESGATNRTRPHASNLQPGTDLNQELAYGQLVLHGISTRSQTAVQAVQAVQANRQTSLVTLRTAADMITRMLQPLHSARMSPVHTVVPRNPGRAAVRNDLYRKGAVLPLPLSWPCGSVGPVASSTTVIVLPAANAPAGVLPALPPAAVHFAAPAIQLNSPPYDALQVPFSKAGSLTNPKATTTAVHCQLMAVPTSCSSMVANSRTIGSVLSCKGTLELATVPAKSQPAAEVSDASAPLLDRQPSDRLAMSQMQYIQSTNHAAQAALAASCNPCTSIRSPQLQAAQSAAALFTESCSYSRGPIVTLSSMDDFGGHSGYDYSRPKASGQAPAASGGANRLAPPAAFMKVARMGIALMGLAAAAAVTAIIFSPLRHSEAPSTAPENTQGGADNKAANCMTAGAEYDGPGYHEWMEERLQAALQQFSAEHDMLKAELVMLQALSKKVNSHSSSASGRLYPVMSTTAGAGLSNRIRQFFNIRNRSGKHDVMEPAAALCSNSNGSAESAALTAEMTDTLTCASISSRIAEIREQLESIDVLKAALTAELVEQQQQRR